MDRNKFTNAQQALDFILGGNSTTTFESLKTGTHLTFKVTAVKDSNNSRFFVKMLTGPDNEDSYSYVGMIVHKDSKWTFVTTKASRITEESTCFKTMNYILAYLSGNKIPATLQIWHEGKCGRCGRKLTVPSSIESGIGPECQRILGIKDTKDIPVVVKPVQHPNVGMWNMNGD